MKKRYLSILGFAASLTAFGQTNLQNVPHVASPKMTTSVYEQTNNSTKTINTNDANRSALRRGNTAIVVGVSRYDLQTNGSVARRVILHGDGTVSMVWTTAPDDAFTQRGTGYKYITQTDGQWFNPTPLVKNRIETIRTGWPNIGVMANGNEYTLGHIAENGGFARSENTGKGTAFTQTAASVNDDGQFKPIWGRMAYSGDNAFMISSYTDSAAVGEPRAKSMAGIFAPMTYSRSTDGGKTWGISHILLPGYDSTRYTSGGGDQYSIDARDSIVAICVTDLLEDLAIWKSTDYGLTFTKTIVDSFKYAPYAENKLMLDTPITHDGTSSVVIDKNGYVHLAWALGRVLELDTTTPGYSFFPGTAAIGYWNEQTNDIQIIAQASDLDLDNSGMYDVSAGNTAGLSSGALPSGFNHVARTGNTSLFTMPSIGLDNNDGVFVSFSAPREADLDELYSINLRDAYIVYSSDNGATWGKPLDATNILGKEEAFPTIAKNVNAFVHMQFQSDNYPGTNLQNNSVSNDNHPIQDNNICYLAIPVSEIIANSISDATVSIENIANAKVFVVSQNSPNPFEGSTEVMIYVNKTTSLNITVTNVAGQIVKNFNTEELGSGNHIIEIDGSDLQSGVYLYTMSASNGEKVTKKMVIK